MRSDSRKTVPRGLVVMGVFAAVLMVVLVLPASAQRQPTTARRAESRGTVIDVKGFIHDQRVLKGPNWILTKFQDEGQLWRARLEVGGVQVKEFDKCGESESWLRFLLWPPRDPSVVSPVTASLLFVLRYGGGANGPEYLDIVDLKKDFATLFESGDNFNFQRIEDMDDDGWPEVVGVSRSFAKVLGLPDADSPFPTLVLSYDKQTGKYVCQNHRFPGEMEKGILRFQSAFDLNKPVNQKVEWDPEDPKTFLGQFAPLLRWVVETYYSGSPDKARQLLATHASPEAAKEARTEVEAILSSDRYYQEIMLLKNRSASSSEAAATPP